MERTAGSTSQKKDTVLTDWHWDCSKGKCWICFLSDCLYSYTNNNNNNNNNTFYMLAPFKSPSVTLQKNQSIKDHKNHHENKHCMFLGYFGLYMLPICTLHLGMYAFHAPLNRYCNQVGWQCCWSLVDKDDLNWINRLDSLSTEVTVLLLHTLLKKSHWITVNWYQSGNQDGSIYFFLQKL